MEELLKKAKDILKKYNQEQLLLNYEKLGEEKKEILLNQILNIDFEQISKLYKEIKKEKNFENEKIEPIKYIERNKLTEKEKQKYFEIGAKEIKGRKLAVVTMAGRTRNKIRT